MKNKSLTCQPHLALHPMLDTQYSIHNTTHFVLMLNNRPSSIVHRTSSTCTHPLEFTLSAVEWAVLFVPLQLCPFASYSIFCFLSPDFCFLSTAIQNWINELKFSTPVENPRQIDLFFYKTNPILCGFRPKMTIPPKNKPNTNPIQSQNKPNFGPKIRVPNPIKLVLECSNRGANLYPVFCLLYPVVKLTMLAVITLRCKIEKIMEKYSDDKKYTLMTKDQVRAVDSWAINTLGIPGVVLMENAGRSCAELIREKLKGIATQKVCIFCGTGNNGGDGYVIARHLLDNGFKVKVVICGDPQKVKGDAKINLDILEKMNQPIDLINPKNDDAAAGLRKFTEDTDMIVDGLFGTGLTGQLRDDYIKLIETINASGCPILAIDIPSGLDCDTGRPLGAAVKANWTVTFVAVKKGFVSEGAASYTGEIFIASIGIEPDS
ncbi:MAG: NAD(P)H-hydrate epimerase [Sedimentisphaerales bacterium]|nr:NAD(P)H-hydrate epimerase [Sedimentisphaerales bacterium]